MGSYWLQEILIWFYSVVYNYSTKAYQGAFQRSLPSSPQSPFPAMGKLSKESFVVSPEP